MFGWRKEKGPKKAAPENGARPVTEVAVLTALGGVKDPDLHEDIVKLGFVKNLRLNEGAVAFDIEMTTPACPAKEQLKAEAEKAVRALPGVASVAVNMTSKVGSSLGSPALEGLKGVKNTVAISSGKGGVGKSTVAVHLALALSRTGAKVGLMDADVYGPSVPRMLAGFDSPAGADGKLLPIERYGVKFISMGLLTDSDTPVIWRGPMATKLVQQFLGQVDWGDLDYLLIDLPPGTGDVQLTLTQAAPLTGAVVVSTPQDVAVSVTMRGIRMFEEVRVPVLGVVENMSGFACPHCRKATDVFRKGGARNAAEALGLPFLGAVPIDPALATAGDVGRPVVDLAGPDRPSSAEAFERIAKALAAQVSIVTRATASVAVAPAEITKDAANVVIKWADGKETKHPFHELRLACPCAQCVDEWSGERRIREEAVPMSIRAESFRTVGRYGLQIRWSDGHSTGIYLFQKLRAEGKASGGGKRSAADGKPGTPAEIRERIVEELKTVFDPEIPVNIYELGLIYGIDLTNEGVANIRMTLTAPNCPAAGQLPSEVEMKARSVPGVKDARVEIVWDPPWDKEMMSEAARLQLGL